MGGQAFKDLTRRILRSEIQPTLQWLGDELWIHGLDSKTLGSRLLGSAGKKETSGDLDINVDENVCDIDALAGHLERILGKDKVKARTGNNQIFTAVPIAGTDDFVQVDFMFGDADWQEFSYWSSANSAYKGLYRTELIKALVAFKSDWVLMDGDEMIARVGPTFFHDRGVVWRYRHRPLKKNGEGRVKALQELEPEEFMKVYPAAIRATNAQERDPKAVMRLVLPNAPYESHDSFETLWEEVKSHYGPKDQQIIADIYLERLNSLKADVTEEILNALGRNNQ